MLSFRYMCVKCLAGIILLLVSGQVAAQSLQEAIAAAQDYYNRTVQEAEDFIKEVDKAYAEYMKNPWKKVVPVDSRKSPFEEYPSIDPEIFSPGKKVSELVDMEYDFTQVGGMYSQSQRFEELGFEEDTDAVMDVVPVRFNGFQIDMRFPADGKIRIAGTAEVELSAAWERMSGMPYGVVLNDILKIGRRLNLCDWSLVRLVKIFMDAVYGEDARNESVITQVYFLHRLGFRVALAYDPEGRLYRLVSTDARVRGARDYYNDGIPYSLIGEAETHDLSLFFYDGYGDNPVCLTANLDEIFYPEYADEIHFESASYPELSFSVQVDLSLKSYYEDYPSYYTDDNPMTEFYYRASLPMARYIQESVYPVLESAVEGKTEVEAVNILLDFVQTAFAYEMDEDRWNQERFFFPGEIWYHDVSDCDDKAMLFARLVQDVLDMKVALVFWPGHLSCAVNIPEAVAGYVFDVFGEKYVSCDPTWKDARAGDVMEVFKDVKASLILL